MKRIIIVFFLILLPITSPAQVHDVEATGEYVMGDNDTKIEARKIALEHAKRLAVEQIGTYLESETVVKDRMLTKDEIRTYASAIIKTTVVSENINLLEGKTTVFKIHIKANVDIGTLNSKIREVKGDKKRKEQIDTLQAENLKLLKELESLSARLKSGEASEYKILRQKRESLLENLEKNQNSMRIALEKGTLLNLALQSKDKLAEDKRNIDDALQLIAEKIKFTIGEPQVRHKGNKADLLIDLEWNVIDIESRGQDHAVEDRIKLFYEIGRALEVSWMKNHHTYFRKEDFKGLHKEELFSYFLGKRLFFDIRAGEWKISHNIKDKSGIVLRGGIILTIADIPIDRLKEITNIDAKVVVH